MSSQKYNSQSCEQRSAPQTPRPSFIQPLVHPHSQQIDPIILHQSSESCTNVASLSQRTASSGRFSGESSVSSGDSPLQQPLPKYKVPKHWIRAVSSRSIPLSMTYCFQVNGPLRGQGRDHPRRITKKPTFPGVKSKKETSLSGTRGREKSMLFPPPPSPKRMRVPLGARPNGRQSKLQPKGSVTRERKNASKDETTKYCPTPQTAPRVNPIERECVATELCSSITFKNLLEEEITKSLQAPLGHKFPARSKEQTRVLHEAHTPMKAYPMPLSSPNLLQPGPDEDIFENGEEEFCPTPSTIEIASPRSKDWDIPGDTHDLPLERILEDGGMEFFQAPFIYQALEGSDRRDSGMDLTEVTFENVLTPGFMPLP